MSEFMIAWGWMIALAVQFFIGWLLWSARAAFASKKDLQAQEVRIEGLHLKIVEIEGRMRNMPAAEAMHELSNAMERLRGDLKAISARLDGTNALMNRVENTVARHEAIFTDSAGGRR